MDEDYLQILAGYIESEEITTASGEILASEEIIAVLECLWDRGVNLMAALEDEEIIFLEEDD